MEHVDSGQNTMVVMITAKQNTTGSIQFPADNWSQSFAVQANNVTIIELPRTAEITQSERVTKKGCLFI